MKRKHTLVLSLLFLFSCGGDDDNGGGTTGSTTSGSGISACFEEVIDGGIVTFDADCSQNASSFVWDFGDGSTSEDLVPIHEYANPGTYTVKLEAIGSFGRNDTVSKQITIEEVCIYCNCAAGSNGNEFEFCGTRQQTEDPCETCIAQVDCSCDTTVAPDLTDGFYVTGSATGSAVTMPEFELQQGVSDAFGQTPPWIERAGFYEGLMYLSNGAFNIVQFENSNSTVYGFSLIASEPLGEGELKVFSITPNGSAATISEGLYHIMFDLSSSTAYYSKIEHFGIIGPAAMGWSTGVIIPQVSESNRNVTFEINDLELNEDYFKIRYNSNWNSDRSIASPAVTGLNILTNFGGLSFDNQDYFDNYQLGGYDFLFDENPGFYNLTLTVNHAAGIDISADFTFTGSSGGTFDPEEYDWGVIGSATLRGWGGPDYDFYYAGEDAGRYIWKKIIALASDSAFKLRANDMWDDNLGYNDLNISGPAASSFSDFGGGDILVSNSGTEFYTFLLSTTDGNSYDLEVQNVQWEIIGNATPGGWDTGTPLNHTFPFTWTMDVNLIDGEYKLRTNGSWEFNLGGNPNMLEFDGNNIIYNGGTATRTVVLEGFDGGDSWNVSIN